MKNILLIAGIIGFLITQGCSNENSKEAGSDAASSDQPMNQAEPVISDSQQTVVSQPAEITPNPAPAPSPAPVAAGMNPAHGEPGHRCDIAVGAPLNSPPGKNPNAAPVMINGDQGISASPATAKPAASPVQNQSIQAVPPAGPTPAGINPPHGEPGHDCAIPVGSPLKK